MFECMQYFLTVSGDGKIEMVFDFKLAKNFVMPVYVPIPCCQLIPKAKFIQTLRLVSISPFVT